MKTRLSHALVAEFLGTMLLIVLGDGVVASVALLDKQADWIVITTGWGLAVALGVYVSGKLSGGHINPAVTLAFWSRGEFPGRWVVPYILAQMAGAIAGAVLVYLDYASAFAAFEAKYALVRGTMEGEKLVGPFAGGAGVFATFPAHDNLLGNLFSEFLGTAVLLFGVRALVDPRNAGRAGYLGPMAIGVLVWAIGLSLGGLTGYAINPARDLGPRLVAALAGWGSSVFDSHESYFWVPILAPFAGGVVGIWLYDLTIGRGLATIPTETEPSEAA